MMTADAVGGVWTYASTFCSVFSARGAEVHLVTIGPRPRSDQRAELAGTDVHLIETDLALEWQDPEGADLPTARRVLGEIERQVEPEIVHLNSFREVAFDWSAPVVLVAHSCVNSWALACKDTAWLQHARWRHYTKRVAEGLDSADVWVCPSGAFGEVISELYQPRAPGWVIYNGIAAAPDFGHKEPFVLGAGRMWDRAKNLGALAEAARGLTWPVCIAGSGASGAAPEGVTLLGALPHPELQRRMRRAAIFASPALYEPFGLSVLEAAAAGCALVLSDIPTFRELWSDAATFVNPGEPRALRIALAELCADEFRRAQLQRAALERSRRYSLNRAVEGYSKLYRDLLQSRATNDASRAREVWA